MIESINQSVNQSIEQFSFV